MLYRMEIGLRETLADTMGQATARQITEALGVAVGEARLVKVFTVEGLDLAQMHRLLDEGVWHDPILQRASLKPLPLLEPLPDYICEIGFRPGVTDNEARTARYTAALVLDLPRDSFSVYTASQYRLGGVPGSRLERSQAETICRDFLCNTLIQRYRIKSRGEWNDQPGFEAQTAAVSGLSRSGIQAIRLEGLDDERLMAMSRENTWALNLEELKVIRAHFADPEVRSMRRGAGLPDDPTDVEMEVLAQTWSEHCKHKIFASRISYLDVHSGRREIFDNLYKSCIRDTTAILRKERGDADYCRSVFKDNAGVIAFIDGHDACIKVETHNSPSALDPYGGALTGIVGVNRDPMGTGMGAELVCNTDVFCFASPFFDGILPPRLLHPRRVLEGVRRGVEHGGNKSGIPTVNGSIVFDERYLGKPLVFCGTVGILPAELNGRPGWQKCAQINDHIVMVGGRIGKDGIHGATFSSEELHEGSPATAVQIGDPITQRKMYDFIIRARDLGLYHAITDNGAGGLSSSVGEMAEDTGGAELDLALAPLKYDGLQPWEILVSEAQERMTLAVPPERLEEFLSLARHMDVEASALGRFTDTGFFRVQYDGRPVACLDMKFMHDGLPQLHLEAVWTGPGRVDQPGAPLPPVAESGEFLRRILGRLNVCSREYVIRQYDHEVGGGSVIKPLVGVHNDGPADAAVYRPVLESDAALVLSHGICPKFSDCDTYWMVANAMDEAIRNAVAVGGNPDALAGVDNFCWCDPVASPANPDGPQKLARLVRACLALRHFALAYGLPLISGKDSMKNDYTGLGRRISIPPTVLISVMGVIGNVTRCQTSDFKKAGDQIYILGGTWRELGCSEAALELGLEDGRMPRVDASSGLARYRAVHALMNQRALSACHDCSDGGLGVALAEMCVGGRLGAEVDLDAVPLLEKMTPGEILYSESASRLVVSVRPELAVLLDSLGQYQCCRRIGSVSQDGRLKIKSCGKILIDEPVQALAEAYKGTLNW